MNSRTAELISPNMTVAQIAVEKPEALHVFDKYRIDYCCGGDREFRYACTNAGLDPEKVFDEISQAPSGTPSIRTRVQSWTNSLLVDYIVQNHHSYVRSSIPEIQALLCKVVEVHGKEKVELNSILEAFNKLADELVHHMHKEEFVLFPAIKQLEEGVELKNPVAVTIEAPLNSIEDEHESAGRSIKAIRTLSGNYTTPQYACPTFKITYKMLEEFDRDLMTHIHLENNVLFERVKKRGRPIHATIL